jgi:hypothetical protein
MAVTAYGAAHIGAICIVRIRVPQ